MHVASHYNVNVFFWVPTTYGWYITCIQAKQELLEEIERVKRVWKFKFSYIDVQNCIIMNNTQSTKRCKTESSSQLLESSNLSSHQYNYHFEIELNYFIYYAWHRRQTIFNLAILQLYNPFHYSKMSIFQDIWDNEFDGERICRGSKWVWYVADRCELSLIRKTFQLRRSKSI